MAVAELVARLAGQVEVFRRGDRAVVGHPRTGIDLRELWRLTGDEASRDAVRVSAWLCWFRFLTSSGWSGREDYRRARRDFRRLVATGADRVPLPLQLPGGEPPPDDPPRPAPDSAASWGGDVIAQLIARSLRRAPDRGGFLAGLVPVLLTRYRQTGVLPDLDQAVAVARLARAAVPAGHPAHLTCLVQLSRVLSIRAERTWVLPDLDEAVVAARDALSGAPAGHPDRATSLLQLGSVLLIRAGWTGAAPDLDEAIELGRAAVGAVPADAEIRPRYLSHLGSALRLHAAWTGSPTDLDAVGVWSGFERGAGRRSS
jgi:hypothetical protein